jgi:hypothetical protein
MSPTEVARQLLARIGAPPGAVSIFAEPQPNSGFVLRVWVTSNSRVDNIPPEFFGHRVIVQQTPAFVGQ